MSRQRIPMADGTLLTVGWDNPFETWYAQHYDSRDEDAPPRAVIGYHPAEQAILRAERPTAAIGPYPVPELRDLFALIEELFGISGTAKQPPCWYCKQPTYEPSDDCPRHPYNILRNT